MTASAQHYTGAGLVQPELCTWPPLTPHARTMTLAQGAPVAAAASQSGTRASTAQPGPELPCKRQLATNRL